MSAAAREDMPNLGRVGFVGVGALGSALARALSARGAAVAALAALHPEHVRALAAALPSSPAVTTPDGVVAAGDLIFLAVPDDQITSVANALPWREGQTVVHLSGARGIDVLAAPAAMGAHVAAAHPLMTFTRTKGIPGADGDRFVGCAWALEAGDTGTRILMEEMIAALGGTSIALVARDRIPYHISGVLASNYVVTLLGAATRLWATFGVSQDEALRSLLPLVRAAVEKLAAEGLPAALTGPIARGDAGTVAAHLAWLDGAAAGDAELAALRDAYRTLAMLTLPLAEAKSPLPPGAAERLRALLEQP